MIGRTAIIDGEIKYQKLREHIDGVTSRSKKYNKVNELENLVNLVALLHDAGKAFPKWQENIINSGTLPSHSRLGMVISEELFNKYISDYPATGNEYNKIRGVGDIISYTIGAHHGFFDCIDLSGETHKLDKKVETELLNKDLDTGKSNFFNEFVDKDFYTLYKNTISDLENFLPLIKGDTVFFELGFITRMVLSILLDADWSDAAAFTYSLEEDYEKELENFSFKTFRNNLENYIEENFTSDTSLNKIRSKISDECKESGSRSTGIYKLSVPTGAGKTIAAMRFALHHAIKWNKDRIFYIAPFISILEQNAEVYKDILTTKVEEEKYILEYHSNLIRNHEGNEWESEIQKYLGETFSTPINLSTMVGFLNILFSYDKQSLRKLHRFQNAVVIIDEIQALPLESHSLLNLAINTLNKYFNTTFLICSATIPDIENIKDSKTTIPKLNYKKEPFITEDYNFEKPFQRVKVKSYLNKGSLNLTQCGDLVEEVLEKRKSILFVVNTRKAAKSIFEEIKGRDLEIPIFHLSNNMCPAHRLEVLEKIRRFDVDKPHIIVTTPLIEAGVDLSVGAVIRSTTKLDSILQAMGRCNRNGELEEKGLIYIVNLDKELEKTDMLFEVNRGKDISLSKIKKLSLDGKLEEIGSSEFLNSYFQDFYNNIEEKTHYEFEEEGIKTSGVEMLTYNPKALKNYLQVHNNIPPKHLLFQGFETFGKNFKAINDSGYGVLVPYGLGKDYISELVSDIDLKEKYKILKKAQRYSVNLYENKIKEMAAIGAIDVVEDIETFILKEGFYDKDKGLIEEKEEMETFIF